MTKLKLLSVVVCNYNGESYLDKCLSSLIISNYTNMEIILIDDGSNDSSLAIIDRFINLDNRIKLFKNIKNQGAAASRNFAIKKAKGQIIVFLDNDTEVRDDTLQELIKPLLLDDTIGGCQALMIDYEDRNKIQMAGGRLIAQMGWLAPFYKNANYLSVKTELQEIPIVAISAALAVKKEVLIKIGCFDVKESVHTEDLDFSWRIWICGYKIILNPKSIVYHKTKTIKDRSAMHASNQSIYYHLAKNSFRSMIKNYEIINLFKYLPLTLSVNLTRAFLVAFKRKDLSALTGLFIAIKWNISKLSDTLIERKKVQKSRVWTDKYIISQVFEPGGVFSIYHRHYKFSRLL